jgi:hypothetical protein
VRTSDRRWRSGPFHVRCASRTLTHPLRGSPWTSG